MNCEKKTKKNIEYLELLRIIACFFVIVNHTVTGEILVQNPGGGKWIFLTIYFFLCKTAVPIFLMISGILLLGKIDSYSKCIKRVVRIVLDIIFFSLIYYIRNCYESKMKISLSEFFELISNRHITNAYWYLYLYLGILVVLPLLQRMANNMKKKEYQYLLVLSIGFLGTMPILNHYFPKIGYHSMLTVPFFSEYIGMMFCGYFVHNYIDLQKKYVFVSLILVVATVGSEVYATYREYLAMPEDYLFFDNRVYIPIVITGTAILYLTRWLQAKIQSEIVWKFIMVIGSTTFGIYLLSDLFIDMYTGIYIELMSHMNILIALVLYQIIVFLTGMFITLILRRVPLIKRII